MGVDPTTDTKDSVRASSWTCSYTLRVKQPVADRIVRTSFGFVATRMCISSMTFPVTVLGTFPDDVNVVTTIIQAHRLRRKHNAIVLHRQPA